MMQHEPWVGPHYERGIDGARVLVAGYSHWSDETDSEGFTRRQVRLWAAGDEPRPFGPRLRAFFGFDDPAEFWNSVAFFNTLPRLVGGPEQRFECGDEQQRREVPQRVRDVIASVRPNRIFVFSRKAWRIWPDYTGSLRDGTLRIAEVGEFDAGSYTYPGGEAVAFGFAHPQFSAVVPTRVAVGAAMASALSDLRSAGDA